MIFKSVEECINFSRKALNHLPNINAMIEGSDFDKWAFILHSKPDFRNYLIESELNILNATALEGLANEHKLDNPVLNHIKIVLSKTDLFLSSFSELKTDDSLKHKIKNLDGLNFLSTLSELSLAYFFKKLGYDILFEKKFIQSSTGRSRDIDLVIKSGNNNELNIEVYMPNHRLNVDGFFDPNQDNPRLNVDGFYDPNQDDSLFIERINRKILQKFGLDGISGLNGKTLLAINKVFFDSVQVKTILPFLSNDTVYNDLIKLLPIDIDGLIIFEDDFGSKNSFKLERVLCISEK